MSELPDPKKSWHSALLRIVVAEESYSTGGEVACAAAVFTPLLSCFPAMAVAANLKAGSFTWAYVCACGWLALVYLCYWRLYTRPRMPTIWEALAGYVLVFLMPFVAAGRTLIRWVREAAREAEEHDAK